MLLVMILSKPSIKFVIAIFVFASLFPGLANAQYGLNETAGAAGLRNIGNLTDAEQGNAAQILAGRVIGTALSMIGIIFFILMIYAGLRWMTARGNSELTQKAMDTMIAATIGMIVVLAAYALTRFVFSAIETAPVEGVETGAGAGGGGTPTGGGSTAASGGGDTEEGTVMIPESCVSNGDRTATCAPVICGSAINQSQCITDSEFTTCCRWSGDVAT